MTHRELPRGQVWFLFICEYGTGDWYISEAEPGHSLKWAAEQISAERSPVAEVWQFIRGVHNQNADGSEKGSAINCTPGVAKILFDRLQKQRIDDWSPADVEFCIRNGYEDDIDAIRQDVGRDRNDYARQEESFRGEL